MPKFDSLIPFKEVDYLISFSKQNKEIRRLQVDAWRKTEGLSLCQSLAPSLHNRSHFAVIEVKAPYDSYYASSLQLAAWMAAGIEKIIQLNN